MANILVACSAAFTLFTLFITSSSAEQFKVGGEDSWRLPAANETDTYARWAATLRFHVGDSLHFKYENDTVAVVDKWGYYHCNSSRAVTVFKDGNTVIKLERPGPVYFTSADPNHCKNGQRLMVEVMALHSDYRAPPGDVSPAPSPKSGARSFFVGPRIVFCCVAVIAVSIIM
ncbi:early nodulin-like protein 7 [Striga hermonthica]|uniref:Early nodulin-like protein 7 n=1 Tax=Striga hermonthica TaxID=68872 RepID=A0A9N7N503_STRHE|nr:early nodulin-like protein 7 [Striga hermonthica]